MRPSTFVAVAVAVAALVSSAAGYQLHADPSNPCLFQGNGTCFDLSKAYPWPAVVTAGKYKFTFNPCQSVVSTPCNGDHVAMVNKTTPRGDKPGIALCQVWHPSAASINEATGGLLEPFATWNNVYPGERTPSGDAAVMDINFPYGSAWRNTALRVMVTDSPNATFSFEGEAPLMQYNFVLQGKNVFGLEQNQYPCFPQRH